MAEAAKTQEPSIEELRARIRCIIAETDDQSAERRTESASPKSDTAAPPLTQAPSPGRASDEQEGAAAISDCSSALLNAAAAIASPTAQLTGAPSDPTPTPASVSRLEVRRSDSALLSGDATSQAPEPAVSGNESQELGFGRAGERVTMSTRVPSPHREEWGEPHSGHARQQLAMSSHGPQSTPASGGVDWEQLISRQTNNAVHSAFNALAQTVLLHNARTLEDMVREMLRPILKVWLDDNLPRIVERLVRTEIEEARRPARGKSGER